MNPIEKLQHKMLKCILGVKRQSSNMASRLECNRSPMLIFSLCLMYNYQVKWSFPKHKRKQEWFSNNCELMRKDVRRLGKKKYKAILITMTLK